MQPFNQGGQQGDKVLSDGFEGVEVGLGGGWSYLVGVESVA